MAVDSIIFFNSLNIIAAFGAVVMISQARARFEKGEFRRIVEWIYYTAVLFFLFQLIFNGLVYFRDINPLDPIGPNFVENYRSLYEAVISLCFIKITYEIGKFSKIYGFAKVDGKFFGKK